MRSARNQGRVAVDDRAAGPDAAPLPAPAAASPSCGVSRNSRATPAARRRRSRAPGRPARHRQRLAFGPIVPSPAIHSARLAFSSATSFEGRYLSAKVDEPLLRRPAPARRTRPAPLGRCRGQAAAAVYRDREQQRAADEGTQRREQQRREVGDTDTHGEEARAPDQVDEREAREYPRALRSRGVAGTPASAASCRHRGPLRPAAGCRPGTASTQAPPPPRARAARRTAARHRARARRRVPPSRSGSR